MQDLVLERMLAIWAGVEPPAAARYAELQTAPFLREVALRTVAQRWARIDREAAALWAASLPDGGSRKQVTEDVALAVAESDPRAALEILAQRSGDELPDAALTGVVTSWADGDFTAAQSWVEAQPAGPARDVLVLRLAFLRAQSDPPAAMQLASQLLADHAAREEAYASIIGPWIRRDPDAARSWVASADTGFRSRLDTEIARSLPDPASP